MSPIEIDRQKDILAAPEIVMALEKYTAFWHGHGYQPWRRLWFAGDEKPVFDISGNGAQKNGQVYPYGWNQVVAEECYLKLLEPIPQQIDDHEKFPPLINNRLFSWHFFGSIRGFIKHHYPTAWQNIKEAEHKQAIPILDPICHPIFPLLPAQIQEILVEAGIRAWRDDYDEPTKKSLGFWLPEMAVNQETLGILAKKGISFVILRRYQIDAKENAPVYEIETDNGPIYALVTDNQMSNEIGNGATDGEGFSQTHLRQLTDVNNPALAANDIETIEHHHPKLKYFLNYLFEKISKARGNNLGRGEKMIKKGKIINNTSWTCAHGLRRWCGEKHGTICRCSLGTPASDQRVDQRKNHYQFLRKNLDDLIDQMDGLNDWPEQFTSWLVDQRDNLSTGNQVGFDGIRAELQPYFKKLLINIAGLQSCGWYFGDNSLEQDIPEYSIRALKQENAVEEVIY